MSEENIVRKSADELGGGRTDYDRIDNLTDEEIEEAVADDPDQELLDENWFRTAEIVVPGEKKRITMNVDQDVVDYFKRKGRGYQTRMNAVLKSYVLHQKRKTPKRKLLDRLNEALGGLDRDEQVKLVRALADLRAKDQMDVRAAREGLRDAEKRGGTKNLRDFLAELGQEEAE